MQDAQNGQNGPIVKIRSHGNPAILITSRRYSNLRLQIQKPAEKNIQKQPRNSFLDAVACMLSNSSCCCTGFREVGQVTIPACFPFVATTRTSEQDAWLTSAIHMCSFRWSKGSASLAGWAGPPKPRVSVHLCSLQPQRFSWVKWCIYPSWVAYQLQ